MKFARKMIAIFATTLMMIAVMAVPAFAAEVEFIDVPVDSPWYEGVIYLAENGITAGTGSGCYSPDLPITVRQWAVMVCRAFHKEDAVNDTTAPFGDPCIRKGYDEGWLTLECVMEPDLQMCRSAVLTSMFQALGHEIYDCSLYPDGEALNSQEYVLQLSKEFGLCTADATGSEILTRGEIAALLYTAQTQDISIPTPPLLDILPIENKSNANLNGYLIQLDRLPDNILDTYVERGWDFVIDYDYLDKFSEERGMDCIGVTSYGSKQIIVSSSEATIHEFGHFLDKMLGFPAKHKELYQAEAEAARPILHDYATTNQKEYFAEYFDYWIRWNSCPERMVKLQEATPLTYEYFMSLSQSNWGCAK